MDQRKISAEKSSHEHLLSPDTSSEANSSPGVGRWANSGLEEAMDALVHPKSDKFSINDLRNKNDKGYVGIPKYDEGDYQMHRVGSYPLHQGMHRLHHSKRRPSQPLLGDSSIDDEDESTLPEGAGEQGLLLSPSHKASPESKGGLGGGIPGSPPGREKLELIREHKDADEEGNKRQSDQRPLLLASSASVDDGLGHHGNGIAKRTPSSSGLLDRPLRPSLKKTSVPQAAPLKPSDKSRSHDILGSDEVLDPPLLSTVASKAPARYTEVAASEPLMSERAGARIPDELNPDIAKAKVKFQLGEAETAEDEDKDQDGKKHQCLKERHEPHSRHHHHHHHKRHSQRKRLGSDVETDNYLLRAVEPEEAELLPTADIEEIACRRFEDPKGIRRHKIQAKNSVSSFIHSSNRDGTGECKTLPFIKKLFDHRPHEVFVELDELLPGGESGDDLEWRETARWIKYEENAQEGLQRWGKPHVASLSFHSLLSLRKCLEQGTVLLDLEERDLAGIAYKVVENMVLTDQLHPDNRGAVMRALLLRHRHVHERSFTQFAMRRNNSGYGSLNLLSHEKKSPKLIPANGSFPGMEKKENGHYKHSIDVPEITITMEDGGRRPSQDMEKIFRNSSTDDLPHIDTNILRRIPEGAEATTVLVGALDFLEQPTIAFVRLAEGLVMPNLMEVSIPVRFFFVLLGPIDTDLDYHEVGRSISTLMANTYFHEVAYKAEDRKDLLCAINEFLDDSIVLPPGDWERNSLLPIHDIRRKSMELRARKKIREEVKLKTEEGLLPAVIMELVDGKDRPPSGGYDPLKRSACLFGGLVKEIKTRYPLYIGDFTDGINGQCLAAAIFIYFACLSGAITFGGLMGDKTNNLIGVSETLIVTSVGGAIFSLFSGQPLIIIGATGPLLLYDEILFNFCEDNKIEYLPMRVWIGIWFGLITTICVAFEVSSLVRFFTRFTQEIFAALISLLYIWECVNKVLLVFMQHPLLSDYCNITNSNGTFDFLVKEPIFESWSQNGTFNESSMPASALKEVLNLPANQPNTALLSFILTFGTYFIAYFLRQFRNSKFLGRSARRALGDFGVPIAIILMVSLGYIAQVTYTQKLSVPEGLTPSKPEVRGWIISPLGMERPIAVWEIAAAGVAALLLFILVFLETQICELIMFKKDRKLQKGSGFHLDLLLLGYLQIATGFVGGPWLCAATVRSVSHLASLTVMSRTHAPGQAPYVIEVKEQRLTSLLVSLMIGISVVMAPLLRQVPVSCLFGVFLYMGVSSMSGIQLFDRMYLLFMPVKHHPDIVYVQKLRTWKMHAYTLIQLACLCVLWVVKSTEAALAFPFVLLMMVPLRLQLKCFFTPKELQALDGEDPEAEQKDDEPDFYEQMIP